MADASILLDFVLADLKQEDITRIQSQIRTSFGQTSELKIGLESGQTGKLKTELDEVKTSAGGAGKSINELDAILNRYNQNILKAEMASDKAEDKFRTLGRQIQITNRTYGELNVALNALRQNENANQAEIAQTEEVMRKLRLEVQRLQDAQHSLRKTAGLDPFGKKMGGIRTVLNPKTGEYLGLKESFTTMQGIGLRMQSLFAGQIGTLMMVAAAQKAVSTAIRETVKVNLELENSTANLRTVTVSSYGDMDRSMRMMTERAKELSHVVPISAGKITESMYFLASGGLKDVEVVNQIAGSLQLATGSMMEHELAAETVTTAYNVWRNEMMRGTEIADKFQISIARNQVTGMELAESFKYVSASGKMVGYTLDDVLGILGALGNLGIRGSMAGTSLNQALTQLSKKRSDLKELGIEITDSTGRLRKYNEVIEEFRKRYGAVVDVYEQEELGKLLDVRAARAIVPFIENLQTLEQSLKEQTESTGDSFKAMIEQTYTLTSGWKLFGNLVSEVAYKIGDIANHPIKNILWNLSGTQREQFEEALKTPEQLSGFQKFLEESAKASKSNVYVNQAADLNNYVNAIIKAGLATEDFNKVLEKYFILDEVASERMGKDTYVSKSNLLSWNDRKKVVSELAESLKSVIQKLEEMMAIEKQMAGYNPFAGKAPYKLEIDTSVLDMISFEYPWQKYLGKGKEKEKIKFEDVYSVGEVSAIQERTEKILKSNKKMELDMRKEVLQMELNAIETTGDARIDAMQQAHKIQTSIIELERKDRLAEIDEQIRKQKELIDEEKQTIIAKGGNILTPPKGTRLYELQAEMTALENQRININAQSNLKIQADRKETDRKIQSYREKLNVENLRLEKELIQSEYDVRLMMVEKGSAEEYAIRNDMLNSLQAIEEQIARQTAENLDKNLKIIENKYIKLRKELENQQSESVNKPILTTYLNMYDKMSRAEFDKDINRKMEQVRDLSNALANLPDITDEFLKQYNLPVGINKEELQKQFRKAIKELNEQIGTGLFVISLPGFRFDETASRKAALDYEKQMNQINAEISLANIPESDWQQRYDIQAQAAESLYKINRQIIEETIIDEQEKNHALTILEKNYQIEMINLKSTYADAYRSDYVSAWSSAFGEISRKDLEETQKSLTEKKTKAEQIIAGLQPDTTEWQAWNAELQEINAKLAQTTDLIAQVNDGTLKVGKDAKKWGNILDDLPQAYSIISNSIQAMNRDMDDSIKKTLDIGEGLMNIGLALAVTKNPLMAMAGIFQTIEALTRKEEKSRKQISDSVYELKKVGQSGVSSSYGQAQNITVNMSNAIKMDFLIPEGLTANRQEQIAEALVDEIQAKLSSRGYL